MMIVFWAAIIAGVVFLVRYFRRKDAEQNLPSGTYGRESATDILEKRYANGELNREEYLVMKADLEKRETSV